MSKELEALNKCIALSQFDGKNYEIVKSALEQLVKYKQIEQELGIDLITLFKALKNGIWSKHGDKVEKIEITNNLRLVLDCNGSTDNLNFWLLDYYDMNSDRTQSIDNWFVDKYGIEWSLNKQDLEK